MKKMLLVLGTGLFLVSCKNDKKEDEPAKNSDWVSHNLKGKVKQTEEASYQADSSGKIGAMDSCCITVDGYNEKGYITSSVSKNSDGKVKTETSISFYEGGQAKDVVTMENGKKKNSFSIQIDKDGKYTGGQSYDSAGKMENYFTDLKENEYGAVLEGVQHKPDSSVKSSFKSEYDKALFVKGTNMDSSGKVMNSTTIKLNDKRDPIEITSVDTGKDSTTTTVTTYKYDSYDDQGNWTQRTISEKGKPTKVAKRTITYYTKEK